MDCYSDTEMVRCRLSVSSGAESSKGLLSEKRKDAEGGVVFKREKCRRKKFETFGLVPAGKTKGNQIKTLLSFFILSK